jgi:outer membrane protein
VKRQGKVLMVAILFLFGVVGIIGYNQNTTYAATPASTIGVVNYELLVSQHPDMAAAQQAMDAAVQKAKSDFDAQSVNMNDQEKEALNQQLQQGLNQKKQELLGPINDKIMAAIKSVADSKGLTIVVTQDSAIYGGQDITSDVGKIISGK